VHNLVWDVGFIDRRQLVGSARNDLARLSELDFETRDFILLLIDLILLLIDFILLLIDFILLLID
jgi:hypothetical protein